MILVRSLDVVGPWCLCMVDACKWWMVIDESCMFSLAVSGDGGWELFGDNYNRWVELINSELRITFVVKYCDIYIICNGEW